ncbi:MAG: hypothetical protein U1D30_14935 [Planctomycetota bacterium]
MVSPKYLLKAAKMSKSHNPLNIYKAAKHLQDSDDFDQASDLHEKARRASLAQKFKLKGMTNDGANEIARWCFEERSNMGPKAGQMTQNDMLIWQNLINRSRTYAGKPLKDAGYILYLSAESSETLEDTLNIS